MVLGALSDRPRSVRHTSTGKAAPASMDYHQSCFPLQNPVPRIPLCQAGGRILEFLYTLYQNLSIQEHVINVFLPPTAEAVRSCFLGEILGLEAAPYLEDL